MIFGAGWTGDKSGRLRTAMIRFQKPAVRLLLIVLAGLTLSGPAAALTRSDPPSRARREGKSRDRKSVV